MRSLVSSFTLIDVWLLVDEVSTLSPNLLTTQTMVTTGILPPPHKENPHGRAGNRTRDLVISSQKLRPLDHETGRGLYEKSSYLPNDTEYNHVKR